MAMDAGILILSLTFFAIIKGVRDMAGERKNRRG